MFNSPSGGSATISEDVKETPSRNIFEGIIREFGPDPKTTDRPTVDNSLPNRNGLTTSADKHFISNNSFMDSGELGKATCSNMDASSGCRDLNSAENTSKNEYSCDTLGNKYSSGCDNNQGLMDPQSVQRVNCHVDMTDKRTNTQLIPKLRFKGAMFSGNIANDNSPSVTCNSTQPLDLSKIEQYNNKQVTNTVTHCTRKRPLNSTLLEDSPLDLSVKKGKRVENTDDDVVFVGEQKSPAFNPYSQISHRNWRPALQMKLKQRQEKAEHGPGYYPNSVIPPSHLSSGPLPKTPQFTHRPTNSPGPGSYHYPGTQSQGRTQMSPRPGAYMPVRSSSSSRHSSSPVRNSPVNRGHMSSGYFPNVNALPAQGLLPEVSNAQATASRGYVYKQQQERTFSHPSQIQAAYSHPSPSSATVSRNKTGDRNVTCPPGMYLTYPPNSRSAHRTASHPESPKDVYKRQQGFTHPADRGSIPPVAHSKKPTPFQTFWAQSEYRKKVMPHLKIDIPSSGHNIENKAHSNYPISTENSFHSVQQLPRAQSIRSITAGTSGLQTPMRRTSENSPPELSIATSLANQSKMTCPSPLPSPQMPILSPQKSFPPEGSPFASPPTKPAPERPSSSNGTSTDVSRNASASSQYRGSKYSATNADYGLKMSSHLDQKFRIHRGNPEVRQSDPISVLSTKPTEANLQRISETHPSNKKQFPCNANFSGQWKGCDSPGKSAPGTLHTGSHSCTSNRGHLIPLHGESSGNKKMSSSTFQTIRIDQEGIHQRPEEQPVLEKMSAFLPTSDKYSQSPLHVKSNCPASDRHMTPFSASNSEWNSNVSLETVTRTTSVTHTTCSTRIVPVANVNPMIQGKAASTPSRPPTNSSCNNLIPNSTSNTSNERNLDIAVYKKKPLRMPIKLDKLNIPTSASQLSDKCKIQGDLSSGPQSVSTTTITTRPTPVSLPSRASTETIHVTTQPVTPIKRGPDGAKCFPDALIQNLTNEPPQTVQTEQERTIPTNNSGITDSGVNNESAKKRRKRKREVSEQESAKELSASFMKAFGKKTSGALLEHMLTPKPTTVSSAKASDLHPGECSSGEVTIARVETEPNPAYQSLKAKMSQFSKERIQSNTQKSDETKLKYTKSKACNNKKLSPLMRKVSKQVAHERGKHINKQKIQHTSIKLVAQESPVLVRSEKARVLSGDSDSDEEKAIPVLKPLSPKERLKILKIRSKSKTPSPKQKTPSPKSSGSLSPRLPQRLAMRNDQLLKEKEKILRQLNFQDSASEGGSPDTPTTEPTRGRRRKARMLRELKNSAGFVVDRMERDSSGDLFADPPSRLSREERALQKAMLRFNEMEQREKEFKGRRRQTAAVTKANQLKKRALKTSIQSPSKSDDKKKSPDSPKLSPHSLTHKRTRSQEAAFHGWRRCLSYHKDDRYELALLRDEERRRIRRRRHKRRRLHHSPRSSECTSSPGSLSSDLLTSPEVLSATPDTKSPKSKDTTPSLNTSTEFIETPEQTPETNNEQLQELEYVDAQWQTPTRKKRKYHWRRKRDGFPKPKYKSKSPKGGRGRGRGKRGGRYGLHRRSRLDYRRSGHQMYPSELAEVPNDDFIASLYGKEGVSEDFPIHPANIKTEPFDDGYDTPGGTSKLGGRPLPPMLKKLSIYRDTGTGETVLHRAARLGYQDVALFCAETNYVDVNARDNAGFTPLHECCVSGNMTIAKYLLAHGADANVSSKVDGIRPLHDAVENDNVEMVRLLLSCGADPNLATYSGRNAIKLARSDDMKEFLRGYFADIWGEEQEDNRWNFMNLRPCQGTKSISGFNAFSDLPPDDVTEESCSLFELSDRHQLPSYLMLIEKQARCNYVLLQDVLERLRMTREQFINIHGNVQFASVAWSELQEQTKNNTLKTTGKKMLKEPVDKNKIVEVIEYDNHLARLLGSEIATLCELDTSDSKNEHTEQDITENSASDFLSTEKTMEKTHRRSLYDLPMGDTMETKRHWLELEEYQEAKASSNSLLLNSGDCKAHKKHSDSKQLCNLAINVTKSHLPNVKEAT